jgi:hypothetical protein
MEARNKFQQLTAAQVRRDFRSGNPPKPGEALPLRRLVAWRRAMEALSDLRARMSAANLNPKHAVAAIVYVAEAAPDKPELLFLESEQRTPEQCQMDAYATLDRDGVIAIGMVFDQYDEQSGQLVTFPYQFTGLNDRAIVVLRKAAEVPQRFTSAAKTVN